MQIPLVGSGILPSAGPAADELAAVTRRAFIPKLVVQLYQATPLLQSLIDNAQFATGGFDPLTLPVQGQPLVNAAWAGFSGTFAQPANQNGITAAQATLKALVVPIPFLGMEGMVQLDHSVIPLIEARLNDATTVTKQTLASAVYLNSSNVASGNAQALTGFPDAIDDGTFDDVYMGLSRSSNPFWKAVRINANAANPTRNLLMQFISQLVKHGGGEAPTMAVTGFGTWTLLTQDFTPLERYNYTPGSGAFSSASSLFRAIEVGGVPVYPDPFAPEGTIWFFNTNYLNLYIHEAAAFAFSGFHSTIPVLQIGFIGVLATILELVNAKPSTSAQITNVASLAI